jgi:membrane fusion protein (multidrug efflux system)
MKGFVAAVIVVVVLAGAGISYWKVSSSAAEKAAAAKGMPPVEVGVVRLGSGPVTVFDEYVAQTDAPDVIEIRSQVTGLVDRQTVADGAHVKKGELLYVIDPRPFESALAQARANLAQAQANELMAQQKLDRSKMLVERNFVSKQDYDTVLAGEQATAAAVDAQKALVRAAELNVGFTVLRAPRDGFISKSLVKPGALVTAQTTLLNTLYSSDPMYVYFSVSEAKLVDLTRMLKRPAGEGPEKAPSFPPSAPPSFRIRLLDGSEYEYPGRVDFVDAALDEKTGTLRARLLVRNPARVLRPGQFVRVIVPALEKPNAIRIPQNAVQELQGLKTVFVVGEDSKAVSRQIEAQYRVGNDWVVDKGLAFGEVVIVEGTQKVRPGTPVKPVAVGSGSVPDDRVTPPGTSPAAPGTGKKQG